ncbi:MULTISPECIES: DnaA N-terminal domain-containing protein [Bacillus]|uniref:DnaA N-terminal domain-containing protein n=1 Tax=Bacillus TaxID=1386 RepID=UPI00030B7285|nr:MULTISPECIES: DnaA N-terminal domain-containing protein [Bacillus]
MGIKEETHEYKELIKQVQAMTEKMNNLHQETLKQMTEINKEIKVIQHKIDTLVEENYVEHLKKTAEEEVRSKLELLWEECLYGLQTKISKPSFEMWFGQAEPISMEGNMITIKVQNEFASDWLEHRYNQLILSILYEITGDHYELKYIY